MLRFFKGVDNKDFIGVLQDNELNCALVNEAMFDSGLYDLLKKYPCKSVLPDRDILFFEFFGPKPVISKDNKYALVLVLSIKYESSENGRVGEYELSVLKMDDKGKWSRKGQFTLLDGDKKKLLNTPIGMVVNYVDKPNPIQVIIIDSLLTEGGTSVGTGDPDANDDMMAGSQMTLGILEIQTKLNLGAKTMAKVIDPADSQVILRSSSTLEELQLKGVRCEAVMLGNPIKPDPCSIKLRLPQFKALVNFDYRGAGPFSKDAITQTKTIYNK